MSVDIVISFDTTGSMAPAITQVRRSVEQTVRYLFDEIPDLRVGIMAHGDYCDGDRVLTVLDLSSNRDSICDFVRNVKTTCGGDSDECYEFVLNRARTLTWSAGTNKAFVLIGDASPHRPGYSYGCCTYYLDWKNELGLLKEAGVTVYPVQAMGHYSTTSFYRDIAKICDTPKLDLYQFSEINDLLTALAMSRAGKLKQYEETLERRGNVSYSVLRTIDSLAGRKERKKVKSEYGLFAVHPSRFQILDVDDDICIKDFVEENGLHFARGKGFYEFTKSVKVQSYKEVVIQHKTTGEMFTGDKAREILGIPIGMDAKVRPGVMDKYVGFIQSTSNNRKLLAGTKFLYEAEHV